MEETKRKRGRPRGRKESYGKSVSGRVTDEEHAALELLAERTNTNICAIVSEHMSRIAQTFIAATKKN